MKFNRVDPFVLVYERFGVRGNRIVETVNLEQHKIDANTWPFGIRVMMADRTLIAIPWNRVISLTQVQVWTRSKKSPLDSESSSD